MRMQREEEGVFTNRVMRQPIGKKWWSSFVSGFFPLNLKHTEYRWVFRLPISLILMVFQIPGAVLNLTRKGLRVVQSVYDFLLDAMTLGHYMDAIDGIDRRGPQKRRNAHIPVKEGVEGLATLEMMLNPLTALRHSRLPIISTVNTRRGELLAFVEGFKRLMWSPYPSNVFYMFLNFIHRFCMAFLFIPLLIGKFAFNTVDFALEHVSALQTLFLWVLPRVLLNIPLFIQEAFSNANDEKHVHDGKREYHHQHAQGEGLFPGHENQPRPGNEYTRHEHAHSGQDSAYYPPRRYTSGDPSFLPYPSPGAADDNGQYAQNSQISVGSI